LEPGKESASPPRVSLWPLVLLGTLVSVLAMFASKRHQSDKPTSPQDGSDDTSNNKQTTDPSIAEIVPSKTKESKSYTTCRRDQTPWWKTLGEGIALFGGIGLLIVNIFQMKATQNAADTAHDSLILSNRPWVHEKDFRIAKPLEFGANGDASIGISGVLENVGHSPALQTRPRNFLMVITNTRPIDEEITGMQKALCDPMRNRSTQVFDTSVFPGDSIPTKEGVGISSKDIQAATKVRLAGPFPHGGYVNFALIACVDYQLSFTSEHHQTRYAFMLGVPDPTGMTVMGDLEPKGIRPDVRLVYFSQSAD
jgi:hypothetical protein